MPRAGRWRGKTTEPGPSRAWPTGTYRAGAIRFCRRVSRPLSASRGVPFAWSAKVRGLALDFVSTYLDIYVVTKLERHAEQLAALGHVARLSLLREIVQGGPEGVTTTE